MSKSKITVLIVGASGMLGSAVVRLFMRSPGHVVWGASRSGEFLRHLPKEFQERTVTGVDANDPESFRRLIARLKPSVVINCIGLVKQRHVANDPLLAIPINSYFPHVLSAICGDLGVRLVHVSTDCVFSGSKGLYREEDRPDSQDLYGLTKLLGEVDQPHAVTLRTSIIGHEITSSNSLISWFLAQHQAVDGYTRAVFSGLPAVEFGRIVRDFVIPNHTLRGVYHVSADPINKYQLLTLVSQIYGKAISIIPTELPVINRSLDSSRFRNITGYVPPDWPTLIKSMHQFR